jgi:hypothetical protein
MLTAHALQAFARALRDVRVLSVYVDARVTDPAMRHAWRPALAAALRSERARLTGTRERAAFDDAARFIDDPTPPLDGAWGTPGWVAFVTTDGPRYAAALPVRVPTLAVWRDGPFVSPYLRALKQLRPVVVALVDSRSARLYRYALGTVSALPGVELSLGEGEGGGTARASEVRGASYPAPRSAVSTERSRRRRRTDFQRLAASLGARLAALVGEDGWVLIGGTPVWARLAGEALRARLTERVIVSETLDHDAPEEEIVRAAKDAATALRAARGGALLTRLLERAGADGRATAGVPATQRALHARAVDLLLVSPVFLRTHAFLAEDAVRAGLDQGADVEVLSGDAAAHLDRAAGGIAARLRFALGAPEARVPVTGGVGAGATPPGPRPTSDPIGVDIKPYEEYR